MLDGYKTYLGIIVAVAPTIASMFGYTLAPEFGEQFTAIAFDIITLGGAAWAIYGRLKAQTPGWLARKNA